MSGTRPLVLVNGNAGVLATMSGEFAWLRRPIIWLGTSPKEYEAPNSNTVLGDGTHVARPTCVRPGELDCVVAMNGWPIPPPNRPNGSIVGIESFSNL